MPRDAARACAARPIAHNTNSLSTLRRRPANGEVTIEEFLKGIGHNVRLTDEEPAETGIPETGPSTQPVNDRPKPEPSRRRGQRAEAAATTIRMPTEPSTQPVNDRPELEPGQVKTRSCPVCLNNDADTALTSCTCINQLMSAPLASGKKHTCPVCRSDIRDVVRLRFAA